jgi:hypothetical protein
LIFSKYILYQNIMIFPSRIYLYLKQKYIHTYFRFRFVQIGSTICIFKEIWVKWNINRIDRTKMGVQDQKDIFLNLIHYYFRAVNWFHHTVTFRGSSEFGEPSLTKWARNSQLWRCPSLPNFYCVFVFLFLFLCVAKFNRSRCIAAGLTL